ncbi:MAG: hypothetical protein ABH865_08670 [Candidatus Omnitrophota bacterium]|nr:hypothetical protein [Candidatus Omnitrophota bacterium]
MNEKTLRIVSFALLADTLVYGAVVFLLHKNNIQHSMHGTSQWYFVLVPALVILFGAGSFKKIFWDLQKKQAAIGSQEIFFRKIYIVTIITLGMVDSLGILGLIIFILTGAMNLPVLLLVLSFAGKLINFPTGEYINNKKRELNLPPH